MPFNVLPDIKKPEPSKRDKKPVCGKKHKKRLSIARGRIMGGNSALPGTHPWMAAIYIGTSDFCAGTLISSCWVVSAAHCFFRKYVMDAPRLQWMFIIVLMSLQKRQMFCSDFESTCHTKSNVLTKCEKGIFCVSLGALFSLSMKDWKRPDWVSNVKKTPKKHRPSTNVHSWEWSIIFL